MGKKLSLMAILLIPIAIAINIVAGQLVLLLKLPIYLDTIGTILTGVLAGPLVGAITGLLTNLINAIFAPTLLPFAVVSIAVGIVAGYLSKAKMFASYGKLIISGVILGLVGAIISAPISAYVFGGVTGAGSTVITGLLLATGQNLLKAVFTSALLTDLSDKILSVIVVYFIIKSMSDRYLSKFSLGLNFRKK